jgi:hypothetical protein
MKTYEIQITELGENLKSIDSNANELSIPLDPANSDYAEYLSYTAWVEAGNNPDEFWTKEAI